MSKSSDESVVALVKSPDGNGYLFIQRRDVTIWALPGGGIDLGESSEQAAIREVKEESGLDVRVIRQTAYYTPLNRLTKTTYAYECEVIGGNLVKTEETADVGFYALSALPRPVFFLHIDWIKDALSHPSEVVIKSIDQVTYWKLFLYFCKHPIQVIRIILSRLGVPLNNQRKAP